MVFFFSFHCFLLYGVDDCDFTGGDGDGKFLIFFPSIIHVIGT